MTIYLYSFSPLCLSLFTQRMSLVSPMIMTILNKLLIVVSFKLIYSLFFCCYNHSVKLNILICLIFFSMKRLNITMLFNSGTEEQKSLHSSTILFLDRDTTFALHFSSISVPLIKDNFIIVCYLIVASGSLYSCTCTYSLSFFFMPGSYPMYNCCANEELCRLIVLYDYIHFFYNF